MKNHKFALNLFVKLAKKLAKGVMYSAIGMSVLLVGCGGGENCSDGPPVELSATQIRALTPTQAKTLRDVDIIAMGANFNQMNDAALSVLDDGIAQPYLYCKPRKPQIFSILPDQITSLSTEQVRKLGSADNGIAKLGGLAIPTFEALVSVPTQVAAITANEYLSLLSTHYMQFGANLKYLSNSVIASMSEKLIVGKFNQVSHIEGITPDQIASFSSNQIKILGTADGSSSKFRFLNEEAYKRMMSLPANVSMLNAADIVPLNPTHIANIGANFKFLQDSALYSLKWTFVASPTSLTSQVGAITSEQVQALNQQQITIISSLNELKGLASLARLSFGSLLPTQVTQLVPTNLSTVTAAQLAALREETIAAIPLDVRQSIRPDQKSLLTPSQAAYFK